jgi:hypothetical protein
MIQEKTLAMLANNGVKKSEIDIFLSDDLDRHDYADLKGYNLVDSGHITNIVDKFNAIHNYYEPGTQVVFVEDDIDRLAFVSGYNKLKEFRELPKLAQACFEQCEIAKTKLWGISSNANPFYMKLQMAVGFKFVVANLFGFVATSDQFLQVSQVCKNDYERTMLYFIKYGSVVRYDGVCAITKNYVNSGGLQSLARRADLERKSCEALVKRFPHLVEINEKKSAISQYMELKLKKAQAGSDYMAYQRILDAGR